MRYRLAINISSFVEILREYIKWESRIKSSMEKLRGDLVCCSGVLRAPQMRKNQRRRSKTAAAKKFKNKSLPEAKPALPALNQSSAVKFEDWETCGDNSDNAPFSGALKPDHTSACVTGENPRYRNGGRLPSFSRGQHGSLWVRSQGDAELAVAGGNPHTAEGGIQRFGPHCS
jgi:hypothetical protein